jgi:hypothetical protein
MPSSNPSSLPSSQPSVIPDEKLPVVVYENVPFSCDSGDICEATQECPPGYQTIYGGFERTGNCLPSCGELELIAFARNPNDSREWHFRARALGYAYEGVLHAVCLLVEDPPSPTSEQSERDVASVIRTSTFGLDAESIVGQAGCVGGFAAIGAGLTAAGGPLELSALHFRTFGPTFGSDGWGVDAESKVQGNWEGTLSVDCLYVGGECPLDFHIATETFSCVSAPLRPTCSVTVYCPTDYLPLSGGFTQTSGEELVVIRDFYPKVGRGGGDGWFFDLDDEPDVGDDAGNYEGTATVFCLKARDGAPPEIAL